MKNSVQNKLRQTLIKEGSENAVERIVGILNALEFKDDVVRAGGEIYAVGGIVRDAIMGKPSEDLDIVVRGIPYKRLFSILKVYGSTKDTSVSVDGEEKKDFGATLFKSRDKRFNMFLASKGVDSDIDIMLPRKDARDPNEKGHRAIKSDVNPIYTIDDDLERRDITINAIAVDLNGRIFDRGGQGRADIKKGIIRAVNNDAFIEDPVRMLRAIRFKNRYEGFRFDPETKKIIHDNVDMLSDKKELPKERFLLEFKKMVGKTDLGGAVKDLVDMGMYKAIFGVEYPNVPYSDFDKVDNVGEMGYLLFYGMKDPVKVFIDNIDDSADNVNTLKALVLYEREVDGKDLTDVNNILKLVKVFVLSPIAFHSFIMSKDAKAIGERLANGDIPVDQRAIKFNGLMAVPYIEGFAEENGIELLKKQIGLYIGKAKQIALKAVYQGLINNDENEIENYIRDNVGEIF